MDYNQPKIVDSPNIQFEFDQNNIAIETLYRLNVGGSSVAAVHDSGMFREWNADDHFVWGADKGNPLSNNQIAVQYTLQTPNYTAPPIVYTTARAMGTYSTRFNLSWIFPVDPGFNYLLRLHFCEINRDIITKGYQRVFIIYISNTTAEPVADVAHRAGGPRIPVYVVFVPNPSGSHRTKQDLFLALHPNLEVEPEYADAILNGLEIFKLKAPMAVWPGPMLIAAENLVCVLQPSEGGQRGSSRFNPGCLYFPATEGRQSVTTQI